MFTAPPTGSFANMTMEECPQRKHEKNMEDVQHRNLDFQQNFVEMRLFEQINGWLAVFKWTKNNCRTYIGFSKVYRTAWNAGHVEGICSIASRWNDDTGAIGVMQGHEFCEWRAVNNRSHGVLMFEDHFGIRWATLLWSSSWFLEIIDMFSFESENPAWWIFDFCRKADFTISLPCLSPFHHFFC